MCAPVCASEPTGEWPGLMLLWVTDYEATILKARLLTATLLVLSQGALAQLPPTGGGQLQQIPPSPTRERIAPEIRIQQGTVSGMSASDSVRITVNSLHVTGETVYREADLLALTGFQPGSSLSLAELQAMALKITNHYRKDGYFLAQGYLPAQQVNDGTVTIAVNEGRYGKISLHNQTNTSDALVYGLLGGLNSGDLITSEPLEDRLLLLSDLQGVVVKSTLVPGATPGTSDLIVDVSPGRPVTGSVEADDAGNPYTGEYRVGATVHINNLAGHGDVATFRYLTSGSGLEYGRASYQAQFGRATAGVAYTYLDYHLGRQFAVLDAHGTAKIWSVYGSYPLMRSRNNDLSVLVAYDDKTFQDKVDLTSSVTDKKIHVLTVGLRGDHRDTFNGGGYSAYALTGSFGKLDIRTPAALFLDSLAARSNGSYGKLALYAMRLQRLTDSWSLYGAINGQLASKNLDISEKMELGGMYAVRAYPEGEAYADEGYVLNLEARWLMPRFWDRQSGQMHLVGFVDTGSVTLNKNPWGVGPNHRTLSGYGVGWTWDDYDDFSVKAYYARKLGSEPATSAPDRSGRFWFQVVKYF